MNIMDAPVPSQRWALPSDNDRDRYENDYELWLDEHYDLATNTVFGMNPEDAWDDSDLFERFMEEVRYGQMP